MACRPVPCPSMTSFGPNRLMRRSCRHSPMRRHEGPHRPMSRRNHDAGRSIDAQARKFRRIAFGLSGEAAMSKIVALMSAFNIRRHWRATGRIVAIAGLALALSACGPMLKKGTPISEVEKDDQLRAQGLYVIAPG